MPETAPHECMFVPSPGPEYDYVPNRQMWSGERAYAICTVCRCRTWLSREEVARRAAQNKEKNHA